MCICILKYFFCSDVCNLTYNFKRKKYCKRKKNSQIQRTEPKETMGKGVDQIMDSQDAYHVLLNKHAMNVNEDRCKCYIFIHIYNPSGQVSKSHCLLSVSSQLETLSDSLLSLYKTFIRPLQRTIAPHKNVINSPAYLSYETS